MRLNAHLNWPHVGQVFQLRRERTIDGKTSVETAYGVTSLDRTQASAEQLLGIVRDHWGAIENGVHWVFGEVRCTIFSGHAPENHVIARNAVLNWLRSTGTDNVTATLRSLTRNPFRLLCKLGYPN